MGRIKLRTITPPRADTEHGNELGLNVWLEIVCYRVESRWQAAEKKEEGRGGCAPCACEWQVEYHEHPNPKMVETFLGAAPKRQLPRPSRRRQTVAPRWCRGYSNEPVPRPAGSTTTASPRAFSAAFSFSGRGSSELYWTAKSQARPVWGGRPSSCLPTQQQQTKLAERHNSRSPSKIQSSNTQTCTILASTHFPGLGS